MEGGPFDFWCLLIQNCFHGNFIRGKKAQVRIEFYHKQREMCNRKM